MLFIFPDIVIFKGANAAFLLDITDYSVFKFVIFLEYSVAQCKSHNEYGNGLRYSDILSLSASRVKT